MKSKKTREKILDVSLELFNQKKASNVSTVQISAAMKISPGNLYYYYANKEEVIRCIWEERMVGAFRELLKSVEKIRNASDLLDFISDCIRYMIEYRFFFTEISTLFTNDDELIKIYREDGQKMREIFSELIKRGFRAERFVAHDALSRYIIIQNAIATTKQMLDGYDVYTKQGISTEEFIGFCCIRVVSVIEHIFTEDMCDEVDREINTRGFDKEKYVEVSW